MNSDVSLDLVWGRHLCSESPPQQQCVTEDLFYILHSDVHRGHLWISTYLGEMLGGSLCLARDGRFRTALHVLTASGQTSQPSKCCIQLGAVNGFWCVQPTNIAEESAHSESVSLVMSKSTVAEESLVRWLTAWLFRAVKSMRLFLLTRCLPSFPSPLTQHSCSKLLRYFFWKFQQK